MNLNMVASALGVFVVMAITKHNFHCMKGFMFLMYFIVPNNRKRYIKMFLFPELFVYQHVTNFIQLIIFVTVI